jgi:3-hydroxybutyryl-CoA dehydrogenase
VADERAGILERVGRPWLVEAVRLLEAGEASVSAVDAAILDVGYAQAPLGRLDQLGLDVDVATGDVLAEAWYGSERFLAPGLQRRLVAEGRLGRATGRGFYRYRSDGTSIPDVEVPLVAPMGAAAILERLEMAVVNEAYRAVADGLAAPSVVDEALRLDAGFPRGPFEIVDELGLRRVVERLRVLHGDTAGRSGDQYVVAQLLWQMATV